MNENIKSYNIIQYLSYPLLTTEGFGLSLDSIYGKWICSVVII